MKIRFLIINKKISKLFNCLINDIIINSINNGLLFAYKK